MRYDVTCTNKECENWNTFWELTCRIADRDEIERTVGCDKCGSKIRFAILKAPRVLGHTKPLNSKEKAIARDLKEAWKIDKELTYGNMRNASAKDKVEAKKEIDRLEHSD